MLNESLYVDLFFGSSTVQEVFKLSSEAVLILKKASMNMRKFDTNLEELKNLWRNSNSLIEINENSDPYLKVLDLEGTTDQRGRPHPPQCITSREDRQIVHMAVTNRSVIPWTIAQHIESVTHYLVSVRTIRRHLQQSGLSARRPLLGLPLTQYHRRLRRQWYDERRMWVAEWNEVVFTDESRICLQHHNSWIRVWRHRRERMLNSCFILCHTGPAPDIMVWSSIGYHSRTALVRIAGTLNGQLYISEVLEPVVLPYLQGLATAIFQQDNAQPHVTRIVQRFFINHLIELLP
ncbi:transposable element Tcb1 transposase [Trichonephila clavipes]|uniref:Transposable element Tcb1 transposase n=1 Tax=Trichonephila clavipes TaxID=2585209 RepID=A0A8X6WDJ6_TRICX|nr:transposable element Tcb1 transposase [Trichonephila clavipes]